MPSYTKAGSHPVRALVAGFPTYLWGGWGPASPAGSGLITAPTRFLINQVQLTTNVATITGTVIEGNIPTVPAAGQPSSLITVTGTQTSAGVFNVTAVAIASVTIALGTGQGTITYPLTNANIGATVDAGIAVIPLPETAEALANGASVPCTMPVQDPKTDSARTINAVVAFPSLPTTATVTLQGAQFDQDSEYQDLGTVATVAGGGVTAGPSAQFTLNQARFYRFNVSNVAGGSSPTIIARLLV